MQALFDRVAENDPAKTLDLLARIAEFVIPKLASTDLAADAGAKTNPFIIQVGVEPSPTSDAHVGAPKPFRERRGSATPAVTQFEDSEASAGCAAQ